MHEVQTVNVDGSPMEIFVFTPERPAPRPALMLLQHLPVGHTGLENDGFTLKTAQRFADNGYVVAVPFLFHWWPKDADIQVKREESRDDRMVLDLEATIALLERRPDVARRAIGAVGHCWGGRVAWLAACHLPQLAGAAVFYGGRVKVPMGQGNPAPISLVNEIRCPMMGFFGNDDQNPAPLEVDEYDEALSAAGVRHVFHRYAGAGHAFQNFPTPERYHHSASEDAWEKVLAFFGEVLVSRRR